MFFAWVSLAFAAVDINSANETELDQIKGVGPAKAKAIVEERKKGGPFKNLDDVAARVKGIGDKTVEGWKKSGEVSVGGGSAAAKSAAPAKAEAKAAAPAKAEAKKAEEKKDAKKSDDKKDVKKAEDKKAAKKDDKKEDKK